MKRVDHMIQYLSGDLSPEEALAFEREMRENPLLKEEFSDVEMAYKIIGDQLKNADENAFSAALLAAMNKSQIKNTASEDDSSRKHRSGMRFLLLAVAASAAILIGIFISPRGPDKIYDAWYNPSTDPVMLTLEANMRGEAGHRALAELWKKDDFDHCRNEAERLLKHDESDQFALLFFLLSSLETDEPGTALKGMQAYDTDPDQTLGQAISWYKALALLKVGQNLQAHALLATLAEHGGPYQKDAHKLKKKLRK